MTVNSHLEKLASQLVLSASEKNSISTSVSTLRGRLSSYFPSEIKEIFQFGSSTRGTILPRNADSNSDIDLMVVFKDGSYQPQTYLDKLKKFTEFWYSRSEISQSHPTIVLKLNHIKFELVPAKYSIWSGYQIPSPSPSWTKWMETDPTEFNKTVTDKNKGNCSKIKPLIRIIKYWNARNGYPLSSYILENKVCDMWFLNRETTLSDYLYTFWRKFDYRYDTPQYIKNKIDGAKKLSQNTQIYESNAQYGYAEAEIKKLVPSL